MQCLLRSMCLGFWVLATAAGASAQQVVVTPQETDELLANPGIGWETFHHAAKQDKSLPSWIPSTLQYIRWGWKEVEPEPGKLNTELLDKTLAASRESGQKLGFRVMCCSSSVGYPYHPKWLVQVGGKELTAEYTEAGVTHKPLPLPDMDDPVVLERHLDLIKRLAARYDGHPDLDHVDIGSIGWWGEWHLGTGKKNLLPSLATRTKVIDAYLAGFKKTPLVMLIGGRECLTYACQRGAGWRADCLGDMGGFSRTWCHMRIFYLPAIKTAGVDVWKTAPAGWESCWDMRKWVSDGWSLRYIFNYALACHASFINNKSAPLPVRDDVRPEVERFLRRLGYRLVLKELSHPGQLKPGAKLELAMKWQNTGSAPCYRPYRVAYRLTDEKGQSKTLVGGVTVNRWLPGSVDLYSPTFLENPPDLPPGEVVAAADSVALPADLPAGRYTLAVGIVDDGTKPVVRLAIQGRTADGWYPVSKIQVAQ